MTEFLDVPGGRLAYDVTGHGPLVVCVPGMGGMRATFRHLAPCWSTRATRSPPWIFVATASPPPAGAPTPRPAWAPTSSR